MTTPTTPMPPSGPVPEFEPGRPARVFDSFGLVTLLGGAVTVLGSFLPWATVAGPFMNVARGGMDADGRFTVLLGLVAVGVGWARLAGSPHVGLQRAPIGLGVLVALIAVLDMQDVEARLATVRSAYVLGAVGPGLYLVLLGGLAMMVGGFVVRAPARTGEPVAFPRPMHLPKVRVSGGVWATVGAVVALVALVWGAVVAYDHMPGSRAQLASWNDGGGRQHKDAIAAAVTAMGSAADSTERYRKCAQVGPVVAEARRYRPIPDGPAQRLWSDRLTALEEMSSACAAVVSGSSGSDYGWYVSFQRAAQLGDALAERERRITGP